MKRGAFITGTNTDIGKTLISALIMSAAHAQGRHTYYFKPLQTGTDLDCESIKKLTGLDDNYIIKPVYSLAPPKAGYIAALEEKIVLDTNRIQQYWQSLKSGPYIVEGGGGLLNPLWKNYCMRELAKDLQLPVIIVAGTMLGTINHTLLTIEAARSASLPILGIILTGKHDPALEDLFMELAGISVLAEVPPLNSFDNFSATANSLFNQKLIARIFSHDN